MTSSHSSPRPHGVDSILHTCAVEPGSPADVGSPRTLVARLGTLEVNTIPPPVATTDAPR